MSFFVEALLLVALIATSGAVAAMHRKLKRLQSALAEYRLASDSTAAALESARGAIESLNSDGLRLVGRLGEEIEAGEALLARLKTATARRAA
jgi:hypothetical protein